jgi:hypothetical protein
MNGEVGQSIAGDVESAEGVVDRKCQVDDRSSRDRRVWPRRQRNAQRPELADLRVVDDRGTVVEDERGGQTVQVYQRAREYDDCGTEGESPVSCQVRPFQNMLPTQYMKSLHWTDMRFHTRLLCSLCLPHSGPRRAKRAKEIQSPSRGLCPDIKGGARGWLGYRHT